MNETNNKRLAKNALFLYVRTFVILLVSLYTSRVVLNVLGVDDFGIYNLVAGIVVLFSFINSAMSLSTQRFLSYELGKNNHEGTCRVFSMSVTLHLIIAVAILILAETVGLWLLNCQLNIPAHRMAAANWVYQFSILTFCINIIRVPYLASVVAHEKMSFFAVISIIEAILKLLIVFALIKLAGDKLILYGILLAVVSVIIFLINVIYCKRKFTTCEYKPFRDKKLLMTLTSFSGWNMFGSFANVGAQQGINFLLNIFFGVVLNAATGIANQVSAAVYSFVANFQTAFSPQLVKYYAAGDNRSFLSLINNSSRISFMLIFLLAFPILTNTEYILKIWLVTVPPYAVAFTQLTIGFYIIDAICGPLWMAVQATGRIKTYQIIMAVFILLNLPVSYVLLKAGYSPESVFITRVGINVMLLIVRLIYLKKEIGLSIAAFTRDVLLKSILVVICSVPIIWVTGYIGHHFLQIVIILIYSGIIIYAVGLMKNERSKINSYVLKYLHR